MFFNWDVYSGDSDTEEVSLLLSVRSQQLVLSAMDYLAHRRNWLDVDDATYDDIDAAVAEAFEEVMRPVMPDFSPVGTISAYVGSMAPDKWLLCDGDLYDGADYPELFAVIDAAFIAGTDFRTPDLQDRFIFGSGLIGGAIGALGGEDYHILTVAEMPAHTHDVARRAPGTGTAAAIDVVANSPLPLTPQSAAALSVGGNTAHNNMPPYLTLNYIIKALP